jgi:hypothetical protein
MSGRAGSTLAACNESGNSDSQGELQTGEIYFLERMKECFENVNKIKPLRGQRNDKQAGIYALEKMRREHTQRVEKRKKNFLIKSRKYKTRF